MSAEEILKLKLQRLESVPDNFIKNVSQAQKKIFEKLKSSLKGLAVDTNGNIQLTKQNFAKINNIIDAYEQALSGSGYYSYVDDFVKEFSEQKKLNDLYLESAIDDFKTSKNADLIYAAGGNMVDLRLGKIAPLNSSAGLRGLINNAIVSGDNILDLQSNVNLKIQGNSEIDGDLVKEAKLNANDVYAVSERGYTIAIAKEFGIQFYLYAGGKMDATRCFCRERVGQVYHIEEIKAWGRMEDLGKCLVKGGWAGMAKGTDESTIFSLAGGYHCMHSWIPKGLSDVPGNVLSRAIEKGYISRADLPEDVLSRLE